MFVRIESLKLFNLTELDSNFKRSSLALHLTQPSFKIGIAYALSFWPQCLCPAPSTVKGGSVHEVLGVTAAQADVQVTFEISDFKKADVLDPSWTDPHNLCSNEGAFGFLVLVFLKPKEAG